MAGLSMLYASLPMAPGCDRGHECPRLAGTLCTVAGTGAPGLGGEGLAPLDSALYLPQDVTIGPDGEAFVVDWNNHRVRVMRDGIIDTVLGTGTLGDGFDPASERTEAAPLDLSLDHPTHVLFAANGDMIVSAWHNSQVIRLVAKTGLVERVAGTGRRSFNGDDKPRLEADLDLPVATAWGADGALLICDQANQRIRRLDLQDEAGIVTTIVGDGTKGYSGDGGPAEQAQIHLPTSQSGPPAGRIATDALGQVYLADTVNHVIRRVDAGGIITTLAGTGAAGNGPEDVAATDCALNTPSDVAIDQGGAVFIADTHNSCVRRVDPSGRITTVAGRCGQGGDSGDGGPATEARLDRPYGVEVAPDGSLWIADTHNHVIRVVYR